MYIKGVFNNKELALAVGVTPATISYIRNNKKTISKDLSEKLEEATGVPREAWMYPLRWHNPYVKVSSHLLADASEYTNKKFKKE